MKERAKRMEATMTGGKRVVKVTAETMAAKQRDISVSEFFAKNRHLLGFDNPRKALLTTVKEAVDNSLDACEEAGILPEITVVIEDLEEGAKVARGQGVKGEERKEGKKAKAAAASRYRVTVVDNGPGIVRKQVENVFGRLLFGSKFHRLKMSRGQQGIGISAAGMYGLITTGKPMVIQTRPSAHKPAHHIELAMNTKTNRAEVTVDEETEDFPLARLRGLPQARELGDGFLSGSAYPTGTSVTIELEGKYQKGRGSVDEFLELTAIANPHAKFVLVRPTRVVEDEADTPLLKRGKKVESEEGAAAGEGSSVPAAPVAEVTEDLGPVVVFPRAVNELPPETKEIQPHPRGVELGTLLQMLKDFQAAEPSGSLYTFLQEKFSRISSATASEFCEQLSTKEAKVTSRTKVADLLPTQAERLYQLFQEAKLPPPPTDCLAPIGVQQLLKGMFKGVRAEFYAASSRDPAVYRGRPFLIESAIAFGGELAADDTARVIRFANRVPLLFQQSACSSFKATTETNWRNYDLQQPRGGLPVGPLVIMIHMASVWVPFTSESKEAIADYDEIRKEMKLALMECGRKLGSYLRKRAKMRRESERRDVFERYIGEIAQAASAITGEDTKKLYDVLMVQAKKRTAIADLQLDDEGRKVQDEDPADQEGVIVVEAARGEGAAGGGDRAGDERAMVSAEAGKVARSGGDARGKKDAADAGPALIDVQPVKRSGAKKSRGGGGKDDAPVAEGARARGESKAAGAKAPALPPPSATAATAGGASAGPGSADVKPKAKLKLRLNPKTGKLEPIEEGPRLF